MTRILALVTTAALLGGCGVDGEPSPPPEPTVSGGVTISNSGVRPHANVGVASGAVSLNIGFGNWGWYDW